MFRKLLIIYCCIYVIFGYVTSDLLQLVKRDTDQVRQNYHVRVLKYFSGRYKSLPYVENTEEPTTTEATTTMEPFIRPTSTLPPDQLDMDVFGGYFTSILGHSLAYHFNVTTKIHSTPPYAMLHHYFHKGVTPPNGAFIGEANIVPCGNVVNFCPPHSRQICLRNETIYCATPLTSTVYRPINGVFKDCLYTSVKVACGTEGLKSCEKAISLHIPCYAIITMVAGDECAKKKVLKGKYCILVVAHQLPKLSNEQFINYLNENESGQRMSNFQFNNLGNVVLKQIVL